MTQPEILDKLAMAFAETEMAGSSFTETQFFEKPADRQMERGRKYAAPVCIGKAIGGFVW